MNNNNIFIISDHYPLSPRIKKVYASLQKIYPSYKITILAWNRKQQFVKEKYVITYNDNTGYKNKLKKLFGLIRFFAFIKKNVGNNSAFIHLIDFSCLCYLLYSRTPRVVYEVYDIKFLKNPILNFIRTFIEKFIIINFVDSIALASPHFKYYYQSSLKFQRKIVIINNKPKEADFSYEKMKNSKIQPEDSNFKIAFIGSVRHYEILKNLIISISQLSRTKLAICGDGPDLMELKHFVKQNSYSSFVNFTGRFQTNDLPMLYSNADVIWAAYPFENSNVKLAVSNKYFESLISRKPIIVSKNTKIGDMVLSNKAGLIVDPYNIESIIFSIKKIRDHYESFCYQGKISDFYWESEEYLIQHIYKN